MENDRRVRPDGTRLGHVQTRGRSHETGLGGGRGAGKTERGAGDPEAVT
jgi:hypothetical protein